MRRIAHANGVVTYTFDLLAGLPVHAHVAARHGGVSPEPWRSLNFSVLRGDTPERVQENRRRLAAALGVQAEEFVHCRQVHGTGVAVVDATDAGGFKDGCDALVTDAVGAAPGAGLRRLRAGRALRSGAPCAGGLPCGVARHRQRRGRGDAVGHAGGLRHGPGGGAGGDRPQHRAGEL